MNYFVANVKRITIRYKKVLIRFKIKLNVEETKKKCLIGCKK